MTDNTQPKHSKSYYQAKPYFTYHSEAGFELHPTLQDANAHAVDIISLEQQHAQENECEWCDTVETLCLGMVTQASHLMPVTENSGYYEMVALPPNPSMVAVIFHDEWITKYYVIGDMSVMQFANFHSSQCEDDKLKTDFYRFFYDDEGKENYTPVGVTEVRYAVKQGAELIEVTEI